MSESIEIRLMKIFCKEFEISEKNFNWNLAIGTTQNWDSLSHMSLIDSIESEFGIRFSAEEIQELKSLNIIVTKLRDGL